MSNSVNENGNGTPRSSHLSPISANLSPTWRPPKSPLPPHRLAKLANALGVSTPLPADSSTHSFLSRSFSESASSSVDHFRRSPTPSAAGSSMGFNSHAPTTSKFLLHVIPPAHLPHDSDNPDNSTLPPPNAPGYHTQFRRGTLLPVHPSLQGQLGAIAKEYALPSSVGLVLYLVTSIPQSPESQAPDYVGEPGPRLSEDIWKHLWTRVLRTEQRDDMLMTSRSPTPQTPHTPRTPLMLGPAARSTPFLPQENSGSLRPFLASPGEPLQTHAPQPTYPITTTSPSTPSSISDRRSNNKSAPPSSTSVSLSEPDTPDTSVEDSGLQPNFLDLPGLNSPSLIPILAKVEFDIDRRKAAWYEPWIRSRKVNHAKRTESRKNSRSHESDEPREHIPIELLTGKKNKLDPFGLLPSESHDVEVKEEPLVLEEGYAQLSESPDEINSEEVKQEEPLVLEEGYARLSESPDETNSEEVKQEEPLVLEEGYARLSESPDEINSDSDSDTEDFGEDATARLSTLAGSKDPLDEVFGTDADTWADIHAENGGPHSFDNPNIVNLALNAEALEALPSPRNLEDDAQSTKEEDEVLDMLDMMSKPSLAISIPSPMKDKRLSSPITANGRKVPPPLMLKPKDKSGATIIPASVPLKSADSLNGTDLAYLGDETPPEQEEDAAEYEEYTRIRSPTESDKRGGAVFDDLDLGLEPSEEFDDDDPNDRRKSQYIMRAQLDEIERTMAQLSPHFNRNELEDDPSQSFNSATLSPSTPANLTLSPGRSFDFLPPPSPRLPNHPESSENEDPMFFAGHSWPAVPFSSIKERENIPSTNSSGPPSPPRLAVNGVTTSAPRSYMPNLSPSKGPSESERRKQELEEENGSYPPRPPSKDLEPSVIPLSPDPFGRHPSTPDPPQQLQQAGSTWDTMTIGKGGPSPELEAPEAPEQPVQGRPRASTTSRFSTDSMNAQDPNAGTSKTVNRTTLMSVKNIKKFWRKSGNKSSNLNVPPTPMPPTPTLPTIPSGRTSPMVPQRPERPSEEQLYLPDVPDIPLPPNVARLSPSPNSTTPPVPRASLDQSSRPSLNQQNILPPPPSSSFGRVSPQSMAPPPPSSSFGRVSPQLMAPPPPSRTSIDQVHQPHRPSIDQHMGPQPGGFGRYSPQPMVTQLHSQVQFHAGHRPSQDQQMMMPPQRSSMDQMGPPPPQHYPGLAVPQFQGRNPNPGPIITPHMRASKASTGLDRLHFDQESPYPTHRSNSTSVRQSPRPPSPPPLPAIPEQGTIPEQEKSTVKKSILRWKSTTSTASTQSTNSVSEVQPRTSFERPGSSASSRGRRPSVINFGSTRASVTSPDLLPPSPQIPNQYVHSKNGLEHRTSQRSRLPTSSTDSYSPPQTASLGARSSSPPRSMTSSRDSGETRPSFDVSQFEFVSPKSGTLSYPYNSIDYQ